MPTDVTRRPRSFLRPAGASARPVGQRLEERRRAITPVTISWIAVGLLSAVFGLFVTSGCSTSRVSSGDVNLISLEDEWQLGRRLEADLAK